MRVLLAGSLTGRTHERMTWKSIGRANILVNIKEVSTPGCAAAEALVLVHMLASVAKNALYKWTHASVGHRGAPTPQTGTPCSYKEAADAKAAKSLRYLAHGRLQRELCHLAAQLGQHALLVQGVQVVQLLQRGDL